MLRFRVPIFLGSWVGGPAPWILSLYVACYCRSASINRGHRGTDVYSTLPKFPSFTLFDLKHILFMGKLVSRCISNSTYRLTVKDSIFGLSRRHLLHFRTKFNKITQTILNTLMSGDDKISRSCIAVRNDKWQWKMWNPAKRLHFGTHLQKVYLGTNTVFCDGIPLIFNWPVQNITFTSLVPWGYVL